MRTDVTLRRLWNTKLRSAINVSTTIFFSSSLLFCFWLTGFARGGDPGMPEPNILSLLWGWGQPWPTQSSPPTMVMWLPAVTTEVDAIFPSPISIWPIYFRLVGTLFVTSRLGRRPEALNSLSLWNTKWRDGHLILKLHLYCLVTDRFSLILFPLSLETCKTLLSFHLVMDLCLSVYLKWSCIKCLPVGWKWTWVCL